MNRLYEVYFTDCILVVLGEGKDETNKRQDNSGIANGKWLILRNYIIVHLYQD